MKRSPTQSARFRALAADFSLTTAQIARAMGWRYSVTRLRLIRLGMAA